MGLNDLGENEKERVQEEQSEELATELGVEDKEDLERLDDRLNTLLELTNSNGKRLEEVENDMRTYKRMVTQLMDRVAALEGGDQEDEEEDGSTGWDL